METLKSPIRLSMFLLCLILVLLKYNSLDYRTASVKVIKSNSTNINIGNDNPKNWTSTVKIISGDHFDEGLVLKVDERLNINDTLFVQYNHFYDVTWISNGHTYEE
jgi:hypothetical protein